MRARWGVVAAFTAVALLGAYLFIAGSTITRMPEWPRISTDDYVHSRAMRYALEQNRIVLVGSSIIYNLDESYFRGDVANLGFPGGISLTGIDVVAGSDRLPELLLIESDVINRPPDDDMSWWYMRSPVRRYVLLLRELHPIRAYVNYRLYGFADAAKMRQDQARRSGILLARPPAADATEEVLRNQSRLLTRNARFETAQANAIRLVQAARELSARGVRVYFVHVSMHPVLESHPTLQEMKRILADAGAGPWLQLDIDRSQLRYPDGVHLDERSAVATIRAIEAALGKSSPGLYP